MDTDRRRIFEIIENTLTFEYCGGSVTRLVRPFSTGWRAVPYATCAQALGGSLRVEYRDTHPREVPPGSGMLTVAGLYHKIDMLEPEAMTTRWAHFNFAILASIDVLDLVEAPLIFGKPVAAKLGDIFEELAELETQRDPLWIRPAARKKELGFRLLSLLADIATVKPERLDFLQSVRRLVPVLQHVRENLGRPLDRRELAELIHVSPSRFDTLFKEIMGVSPMSYVQGLRIRQAQMMLIETDLPVARVAQRAGFNDPFHFSRLFKRLCGVAPSDYRVRAGRFPG